MKVLANTPANKFHKHLTSRRSARELRAELSRPQNSKGDVLLQLACRDKDPTRRGGKIDLLVEAAARANMEIADLYARDEKGKTFMHRWAGHLCRAEEHALEAACSLYPEIMLLRDTAGLAPLNYVEKWGSLRLVTYDESFDRNVLILFKAAAQTKGGIAEALFADDPDVSQQSGWSTLCKVIRRVKSATIICNIMSMVMQSGPRVSAHVEGFAYHEYNSPLGHALLRQHDPTIVARHLMKVSPPDYLVRSLIWPLSSPPINTIIEHELEPNMRCCLDLMKELTTFDYGDGKSLLHCAADFPLRSLLGAKLGFATIEGAKRMVSYKKLIKLLVQGNPEAAHRRDSRGRTPLHLAAARNIPWDYGLEIVHSGYPDAIETVDSTTRLYPFMAAAVGEDADITTIYNLLRCSPSLVLGQVSHG